MTYFSTKDKKKLEMDKTLISIILFFTVSILCAGFLQLLNAWQEMIWLWL